MTLVWLIQHLQHVRSEIYRLTVIFIWVDKVKVDLRIGKGRHYRWPVLISWYCYAKSVQLWLDSRPGPGSRCGPPSRKWDCAWLVTHDIISTVTSSRDNNNSAQSKYHGDHQHPAQFEFMTLIINKEEARSCGRILKNKWKICCHSETITAFIPPAHVSCAQNVTGVIRDSELMSRCHGALTIFYMSKHWLREARLWRGQNETLWAVNWN